MKKTILTILLIVAYVLITLFGFLSGMFSESLIGSAHPMADALADVITWGAAIVALSPAVCLLTSSFLRGNPVARRIVLAIPFVLLLVQMVLGHIAEML